MTVRAPPNIPLTAAMSGSHGAAKGLESVWRDGARVLEFWFGTTAGDEDQLPQRYAQWFGVDASFDERIRTQFGTVVAAAGRAELDHFATSARASLALILLLDQFPRNIYRGTAAAYAFDDQALQHCLLGLEHGWDRQLHEVERMFFYLPLEHAEDPASQRRSVDAFGQLCDDANGKFAEFARRNVTYALEHRDLIDTFGRFPHRNAVLGRQSTAAEQAYLDTSQRRFGQG